MGGPASRNDITDIAGLRVGRAEHDGANTGVSVILCDQPFTAAVDVRVVAVAAAVDALESAPSKGRRPRELLPKAH